MKQYAFVNVPMYQCTECGSVTLSPGFDCAECSHLGNTIVDAGETPEHEHTDFQRHVNCPCCGGEIHLLASAKDSDGMRKCYDCGFIGRLIYYYTEDLEDILF